MKLQSLIMTLLITQIAGCAPSRTENAERASMYEHSRLVETEHMLEWLHPEPIQEIEQIFTDYLNDKAAGSQLLSLSVVSAPQWLTGGKPQKEDGSKAIVTRTGVSFLFSLKVQPPNGREETVTGVFSWVGVLLDDPPNSKQRTWIDVGGTLDQFGSEGKLKIRIYALQTEDQAPPPLNLHERQYDDRT